AAPYCRKLIRTLSAWLSPVPMERPHQGRLLLPPAAFGLPQPIITTPTRTVNAPQPQLNRPYNQWNISAKSAFYLHEYIAPRKRDTCATECRPGFRRIDPDSDRPYVRKNQIPAKRAARAFSRLSLDLGLT